VFDVDLCFFWSAHEVLQDQDPVTSEVEYLLFDGPYDHPNSRYIGFLWKDCFIRDIWEEEDVEEVGREIEAERDEEEEE